MASFIYDANSPQSPSLQWQAFLGHQDLHSDIASAIGAQTLDLRHGILQATNSINHSTAMAAMAVVGSLFGLSIGVRRSISRAVGEVVDHIDTGFANVVDHLDTGFENLQRGLSEVNFNLRNLGSMLDWRLALVTDQLAVSNLLLENIALLLRIPDIQKERQYYIEQGFKHYNNARINPDLYQDALDNLLEAEKREKTDYVVLHRIGLIYLYAPNSVDLYKAEDYFRRASKYAAVESDPDSARLFNILAGDVKSRLSDQSTEVQTINLVAAESFFQTGVACYAQGNFSEAALLCGRAFSLAKSLPEAGFTQAKALAALGDAQGASDVLESVIAVERYYSAKAVADKSLADLPEVQSLLLRLRDEAVKQARDRLSSCRGQLLDTPAAPLIPDLEQLVDRNSYLDALTVMDELAKKRGFWKLPFHVWIKRASQINLPIAADAQATCKMTLNLDYDLCVSTGSQSGCLYVWSARNPTKPHVFEAHDSAIQFLALNTDGTLLASLSEDATLKVWSVENWKEKRALKLDGNAIGVAFRSNDELSAFCLDHGTSSHTKTRIVIWDVETEKELNHTTWISANGNGGNWYSLCEDVFIFSEVHDSYRRNMTSVDANGISRTATINITEASPLRQDTSLEPSIETARSNREMVLFPIQIAADRETVSFWDESCQKIVGSLKSNDVIPTIRFHLTSEALISGSAFWKSRDFSLEEFVVEKPNIQKEIREYLALCDEVMLANAQPRECPRCYQKVAFDDHICANCKFPVADYERNLSESRRRPVARPPDVDAAMIEKAIRADLPTADAGCGGLIIAVIAGVLLCFVPLIGWIIGALVILGGILGFLYCLLPVGFRLWWYRTFNSEEFNKLHLKALGGFTSPFLGACPKCKGRIREQPAKDSSVYTCPHCRSRLHHQSSYIYCVPFEDAVPNNDYGTLFASLDNSQKKRLYIYDNNEIKGPFTPDYVDRSVCKMARFSPELPVCIEGTEDWIPFHKLTDDVFSVNFPSSAAAHGKQDHAILAYLKRAEQGDADAQYKLGEMYEEGNGVPKNGEKAAEWYGNAADQGHALAQAALGALYLQGIAVPKDEAKGFEWVQKSAVQGYGIAQFALGLAYANGRGVPQNFILAYTWFNLAAESGNMDALKAKDFMRQKLTSEQMAESQNLSTKFSDKISNK